MKHTLLMLSCFFLQLVTAQTLETKRQVQQLIPSRTIHLNGGINVSIAGGNSRTYIKIDLPPKTIAWYYSFSTSGQSTDNKKINLAGQIEALLQKNKTPSEILANIYVPNGSQKADIYVCDGKNIALFQRKVDNEGGTFYYIQDGTMLNTLQGTAAISSLKNGSWYLGIKNPSQLNGIYITIEAVAITETQPDYAGLLVDALFESLKKEPAPPKNDMQRKAESYGTMGWGFYEKGKLEKGLQYCDRSLSIHKLGWVMANKGLMQLISGHTDLAIDTYIDAIALVKKQWGANKVFSEMIKGLKKVRKKRPDISETNEIIDMIRLQRNN